MLIDHVASGPITEGYRPVELLTGRGAVSCRYYEAPGASLAAIMVGGAGGGWDTPAGCLYPSLCSVLSQRGLSCLRVSYRLPNVLGDCALDVLAGISFLEEHGVQRIAVVGHSFGGAVAIQAAAVSASVRTVITLATQSYGADAVALLAPRCSILLVHGADDTVLPPYCSEWTHFMAGGEKRFVLYDGAGHSLEEVSDLVHSLVANWVISQLESD